MAWLELQAQHVFELFLPEGCDGFGLSVHIPCLSPWRPVSEEASGVDGVCGQIWPRTTAARGQVQTSHVSSLQPEETLSNEQTTAFVEEEVETREQNWLILWVILQATVEPY